MVYKYFSFSIAIAFISFIVGMTLNAILRRTEFYNKKLSTLNFIKSESLNKIIGIGIFKWIVKNTFFKLFNQKLKLKKKIEKTDLIKLRNEMTISEMAYELKLPNIKMNYQLLLEEAKHTKMSCSAARSRPASL